MIASYIHHNGKVGVLVELNCETDFVARTDDFKTLAREVASTSRAPPRWRWTRTECPRTRSSASVASPRSRCARAASRITSSSKIVDGKVEAFYKEVALLSQPWIREDKKTIGDLIKEASAKLGENMQVRRFVRFQMGEE